VSAANVEESRRYATQARAALLRGENALAFELAQKAVAGAPENASLQALCGRAASLVGRRIEAARHYGEASRLDPLNFGYYWNSQRYSSQAWSLLVLWDRCAALVRCLLRNLSPRNLHSFLTSWETGRFVIYAVVALLLAMAALVLRPLDRAQALPFLGALALAAALLGCLWVETKDHKRRMAHIPIRVHVNGIRGKSTVTRLIAAVLRCKYTTLAKTTGSKPCVIFPTGDELEIIRRGRANIKEQIVTARRYAEDVDALVFECMAVNPEFQMISEQDIVQSTIGVITNVREDHQDLMGLTLRDIALSIGSTVPYIQPGFIRGGYLITTEVRHLAVLADVCQKRGTKLIYADSETVTDEELHRFPYMAFKDNIALALEFAKVFHIPRDQALQAMVEAKPDVGAVVVRELEFEGKKFRYAPLWAVNDRESAVVCVDTLRAAAPGHITVLLLNNRADRQLRTVQFADIASLDVKPDYVMTLGEMGEICARRLKRNGFPSDRILVMDGQPVEAVIRKLVEITPERALIIPTVNIHTRQAHELRERVGDVL